MTELQYRKIQWLSRAKSARQKLFALQDAQYHLDSLIQQMHTEHCPALSRRISRLQQNTQHQMLSLLAVQEEIRSQIDSLPDLQLQAILIRRYLNDQTMEQIAESMFYDLRTIQRKHKQALDFLSLPISETSIFPDISCEY